MKAISLWQPWASLVVLGLKQYETRSWRCDFTGTLAVHASKRWDGELREMCLYDEPFAGIFAELGVRPDGLPRGSLLGTVRLEGCLRTADALKVISTQEVRLGDYGPGRWAWKLSRPRQLPAPAPWRGAMGLFDVPDDALVFPEPRAEGASP